MKIKIIENFYKELLKRSNSTNVVPDPVSVTLSRYLPPVCFVYNRFCSVFNKFFSSPIFCYRNTEDGLINVSLNLADKYDVPIWEVMLAFAEFLFVDSG